MTAAHIQSLDWAAASDLGCKRKNNEDSWGVFVLGDGKARALPPGRTSVSGQGLVLIVSDGMGGARAGEVASRFCIDNLSAGLAARAGKDSAAVAMREAFLAVHRALGARGASTEEWRGMGATLSALWLLADGRTVLGHVGDSRIYGRAGDRVHQLTEDHSIGEGMVRRGEMTSEAARRMRFHSLLEQAMGGEGEPIDPQIRVAEAGESEAYALCSDGLYGPLAGGTESALTAALAIDDLTAAADGLIGAANAAGGPDNITVLLARLLPGARP